MPRYHFNVYDGTYAIDDNGTELPDREAAQREAVRLAAELLAERPEDFWGAGEWRVEVTNSSGVSLFTVHFLGTCPKPSRPRMSVVPPASRGLS